jgi:hypothetical protein
VVSLVGVRTSLPVDEERLIGELFFIFIETRKFPLNGREEKIEKRRRKLTEIRSVAAVHCQRYSGNTTEYGDTHNSRGRIQINGIKEV